ncbi:MAG: hypothetical protein Q8K00_08910 [Syntrophales bacterium]|nr:hypothetical protein [Syntrophales bacterium]
MNPVITLDEESGPHGRTQNRDRRAFRTDRPPISLPKKDELLMLLHLNRLHEDRQKLPERHVEHILTFPLIRVK